MMRLRLYSAALSAGALFAMAAPPIAVHAQDAAKGSMLLADARKALGGDGGIL